MTVPARRYALARAPLLMVMPLAGDSDRRGEQSVRIIAWLRLPGRYDPAPHPVRLAGVCAWAAGLALLGLPVAGRSSVAVVAGTAPGWFEPTVVIVGLLGIGTTASGFAAIHRRWLPWLLLVAGTGLLAVNLLLTLSL